MNAIELLKSDHARVEGLFQEAEAEPGSPKVLKIFDAIKLELETHAHLEETIFYPAIAEAGDQELRDLTSEALTEHKEVEAMLDELSVTDEDSFDDMFVKLIEDVRRHVTEEEGEMFPLVESQLDADALDDLEVKMQAEKERVMSSAASAR